LAFFIGAQVGEAGVGLVDRGLGGCNLVPGVEDEL
jgi:hypothetical protein